MKAVLVIDVQNDYCHPKGLIGSVLGVDGIHSSVQKMNSFLDSMRTKELPIIHIQMTEDAELIQETVKRIRMKNFGPKERWELAKPGTWGYELMLDTKDEPIFKKNTYDAFSNKGLVKHLRELGVTELIVIGGYTHACVDATVRSAVTNGFNVTVIRDMVGSPDALNEAHEGTLKVLGLLFADVIDSSELEV